MNGVVQRITNRFHATSLEKEIIENDHLKKHAVIVKGKEISRNLLTINEIPPYLKRNPYILTGYRANLTVRECLDGMFWWTNETVNIWTHLTAFILFVTLLFWFTYTNPMVSYASTSTKVFYYSLATCFISTMLFSTLYHMFIFQSEQLYKILHTLDLVGVAFSILGVFIAGITHGFQCHMELKIFYLSTMTGIFLLMLVLSLPHFGVRDKFKKLAFFLWMAFGLIPVVHWFYIMGGYNNSLVQEVVPRLLKLYGICAVSFFFLVSKFPECLLPGTFDIIGSSHQWWHILTVYVYICCLHNACEFINYVKNVACPDMPLY